MAWVRHGPRAPNATTSPRRHLLSPFVAIYLLISYAFVSGDFADFAPFSVENRLLFSEELHLV